MPTARTPSRLEWTGYAFVWKLLMAPALALFILTVVAIPLVLVTAGVLLLLVAVPLTGQLTVLARALAGRGLGMEIRDPYRRPDRAGVLVLLNTWATDPARWRALLWLLFASTIGFAMALFIEVLFVSIAWYLVFPFVWAVTPDGVFDMHLGLVTIDTLSETFLMWLPALVAFALWWWLTPPLGRGHALMVRGLLGPGRHERLERRVQDLADSRADSIDFSAAELRRVERDLHDGAQARLVALGMSLGMADDVMSGDPEAARRWLDEARSTTTAALADLRTVVRGIHPPVLADRGLAGAVQALAMDLPLPVLVSASLSGRAPEPVESAAYFAVAECLTNVVRHSAADRSWVEITHHHGALHLEVGDDGAGGAAVEGGTGLAGVARRLSTFDGTLALSSPVGGPTTVRMEVPCALSSPRISRSSGTG